MTTFDEHDEDEEHVSAFYGLAPGIAGVLLGLALIVFMFIFADGFS